MPRNVEAWIARTEKTGLLDFGALHEAARKDVANQQSASVCSKCLHASHPTHACGAMEPDDEHPLDSARVCGCDWVPAG